MPTEKKPRQSRPSSLSNTLEGAAAQKAKQRQEAHQEARAWADRYNAEFPDAYAYITVGRDGTPRLTVASADHPITLVDPVNPENPDAL